jgi:hypothetical protein
MIGILTLRPIKNSPYHKSFFFENKNEFFLQFQVRSGYTNFMKKIGLGKMNFKHFF